VDEEEMNVSVFDYISIDCFDLNKNYSSALQQIHSVIIISPLRKSRGI